MITNTALCLQLHVCALALLASTLHRADSQSGIAGVPCSVHGSVRLVGGPNNHTGRVELCVVEEWSPLCDHGWSVRDAEVVCRQLGLTTVGAQAYGKSLFGAGLGVIEFTDFQCKGSEASIINCTKNISTDCGVNRQAGVSCIDRPPGRCESAGYTGCCPMGMCDVRGSTTCYCDMQCYNFNDCCDDYEDLCPSQQQQDCTNNEVRLVGGDTSDDGRVELCVNGSWSTVCDDGWTSQDAEVVCTQLGLNSTNAKAVGGAVFGQGNVSILVSHFQCDGTENMLASCSHANASIDCGHQRDAGVTCTTCNNGDVRLVNSNNHLSGQVQICGGHQWNTICDDTFDDEDAGVVCRQLGFSRFGDVLSENNSASVRYQPISVDVQCSGNESIITDCFIESRTENCSTSDVVSVQCFASGACERAGKTHCCALDCKVGPCYCDSACSMFGDCCNDTSRVCSSTNCTTGNVRLTHGLSETEGIVQMCANGRIGLVCGANWTTNEARVLCRSIGYSYTGAQPASAKYFSKDVSAYIVGGEFNCSGDESSLLDCTYSETPSCGVDEAVGVVCEPACNQGGLRLVNGSSPYEGRVELCKNGVWGTVCDEGWSNRDAEVICRQLNYSAIDAQSYGGGYFYSGLSVRPIHITGAMCSGMEDTIDSCLLSNQTSQCMHLMDAGVRCSGLIGSCQMAGYDSCCTGQGCDTAGTDSCFCDTLCFINGDCCNDVTITCPLANCTHGEIRVVDGSSPLEGRVEVCVNKQWSTVCGDEWDIRDARVVCNQIGHPSTNVLAYSSAVFGQGVADISVGGFQCTRTESGNILQCQHLQSPDCSHEQDAGVSCKPANCMDNAVRLVGGETMLEGNVEICRNGSWTAVCDSMWNNLQATVVCRQLEYSYKDASGYLGSFFGSSVNDPGFSLFQCTGTEQSLTDCPHSTAADCSLDQLAGVRCTGSVGPCQSAGYVECCTSSNCTVATSNGSCDCKTDCHTNNTCCSDINTICPLNTCSDGGLRLVDSPQSHAGRVEICISNQWRTVCDKGWGSADAQVVCRELGYTTYGAQSVPGGTFPPGSGTIGITDAQCVGSESSLSNCTYTRVALNSTCLHQNDAGVICTLPCINGSVQIVGPSSNSGHVQVCVDSDWVAVCANKWTTADANMVCSELGFTIQGRGSQIQLVNASAVDYAPNIVDVSQCNATNSIPSCISPLNSSCTQLAGVICQISCTEGAVRLTGGITAMEGLVEICHGGVYGTLCDVNWCGANAKVVCGQLGYSKVDASAIRGSVFDSSNITNIHSHTFKCSGTELNTSLCRNAAAQTCSMEILAGVQCTPKTLCESAGYRGCCVNNTTQCSLPSTLGGTLCYCDYNCHEMGDCCDGIDTTCPLPKCQDGELSLVGGLSPQEGYIQFCNNGSLGMVCADQWGHEEAIVVCDQLGLPSTGADVDVSFSGMASNVTFVAGDFQCVGNESNLTKCLFTKDFCCQSNQPAAVLCQEAVSSTSLLLDEFTSTLYDEGSGMSSTAIPVVLPSPVMTASITFDAPLSSEPVMYISAEPVSFVASPEYSFMPSFSTGELEIDTTAYETEITVEYKNTLSTSSSQGYSSSVMVEFSQVEISSVIEEPLMPLQSTPLLSSSVQPTVSSSSSSYFQPPAVSSLTSTLSSTTPQLTTPLSNILVSPTPVSRQLESTIFSATETPAENYRSLTSQTPTNSLAIAVNISTSISTRPSTYPTIALENRATLLLGNYTTKTFETVAENFRVAVADAINEFCEHNMRICAAVLTSRKRQSNTGIVSSEDVVVTDTRDTSDGLEVRFYAQLRNGAGVLPRNVLEQSVQEAIQNRRFTGLGTVVLIIHSINPLPTVAMIAIIVVGATLVLAVIMIITVTTIQCYRYCTRTKTYSVVQNEQPPFDSSIVIENRYQPGLPTTFDYTEKTRISRV